MFNEQLLSEKEAEKLGFYILTLIENTIESEYDKPTMFEHTITNTSPGIFDKELTLTTYIVHKDTDANGVEHTRYQEVDGDTIDLGCLEYGRVYFEETPENKYVSIFDYFETSSLHEILQLIRD